MWKFFAYICDTSQCQQPQTAFYFTIPEFHTWYSIPQQCKDKDQISSYLVTDKFVSEISSNAKDLDGVGNMKQKYRKLSFQLYHVRHRIHRILADISRVLSDISTLAHAICSPLIQLRLNLNEGYEKLELWIHLRRLLWLAGSIQ